MKRLLLVLAISAALAALLFPASRRPHKTTHTATACDNVTDLGHCPATGCSDRGDPKLNAKKNRTDAPVDTPELWTFDEIMHLEDDRPQTWTSGQERTEVEDMGEDTPIKLAGYLIGAHPGSPETCNCKLSGDENNDIHINIVQNKTGKLTDSIVTEMTPRVRASHDGWDKAQDTFDKLLANGRHPYVRVTGYLLFDSEHVSGNGGPRATIWEVHPITAFDVCSSTPAVCDQGKSWTPLEKWKPSAAPAKKKP